MNETFAEFLNSQQADSDTLQQALRYYLAERTEDLPMEDMREELIAAVGDAGTVNSTISRLEGDSETVDAAALVVLSAAWDDPAERERVRSAVENARVKLPVIEVAIIAVAAMYALWLLKTGGVKETEETTHRGPDGSFEQTRRTEYYSAEGPLRTVIDLVTGSGGN
jgi:hypothetical protein